VQRASKKEKEAKIHMVEETEDASTASEETAPPTQNEEEGDNTETRQIQKSVTTKTPVEEAKAGAHPGDIRRVMGKKTAKVKFAQIVEEDESSSVDDISNDKGLSMLLDEYWEDSGEEDFHQGD
jgi:hypothetical protein